MIAAAGELLTDPDVSLVQLDGPALDALRHALPALQHIGGRLADDQG